MCRNSLTASVLGTMVRRGGSHGAADASFLFSTFRPLDGAALPAPALTVLTQDGLAVLGKQQRSYMPELVQVTARAVEDAVEEVHERQVERSVVLVRWHVQGKNLQQGACAASDGPSAGRHAGWAGG